MVFIVECGNFDCSKQKKKVFQDFEPMFSLKDDKNTENPSRRSVLAKITHHDYSNKIKDKMAKFTKR